jgi:hypothetical protein
MTLEIFTRDILPLIQCAATIVGLGALFLLWWQIRETRLWNKLNSPHNFGDSEKTSRLEKDLYENLRQINVDPRAAIDDSDVEKIISDDSAYISLKAYLNDLENICAAVGIGSVDKECAYAVHSCRVIEVHKQFSKFISAIQKKLDDPEVYIELQKVAAIWETRVLKQRVKEQDELQKVRDRLDMDKGVKPKV